jgi:hypothetical protein
MTDESVKDLILAFNSGTFPSFVALRPLSDTVTLGYVWPERPTGRVACESSRKVYFILAGSHCVGVVVEMGFNHSRNPFEEENLHWYVLEEHRNRGHLHAALRDFILPHIFSDDREVQTVTTDSEANARYVARQGFTPTGEMSFAITKEQVDVSRVPEGRNSLPTRKEMDELKARLREAKALIVSVSERLRCHYGEDSLSLDALAEDIEEYHASRLLDLPIDFTSDR